MTPGGPSLSGLRRGLQLSSLRPQHQIADRFFWSLAAGQDLLHLRGNRQLDGVPRAQRQRGFRRAYAFRGHPHAGQDVVERSAVTELDADVAVPAELSCAGEDEIAKTAEPRQRLALTAHRAG